MWTVILFLIGFMLMAISHAYFLHMENKEFDAFKVNILEFEHYPNMIVRNRRKMHGYAKVTWEGQDFPVELYRSTDADYSWVFNRTGDRGYCTWDSLDNFNSYFTIPPQVHYRVNEEWKKRDREAYEKRKAEYIAQKKKENGLS